MVVASSASASNGHRAGRLARRFGNEAEKSPKGEPRKSGPCSNIAKECGALYWMLLQPECKNKY